MCEYQGFSRGGIVCFRSDAPFGAACSSQAMLIAAILAQDCDWLLPLFAAHVDGIDNLLEARVLPDTCRPRVLPKPLCAFTNANSIAQVARHR
jgi:hypothetical protein